MAEDRTYPPIRIFRPGTFKSMEGAEVSFGAAELRGIAHRYDAAKRRAPIVVGHPPSNGPAEGWIERVTFDGDFLLAHPSTVKPALVEAVRAGRWRKVSASFYPPARLDNPTPGLWHLRHVGMLGAHPPAVKGLGHVSFAEPVEIDRDAFVTCASFAAPAGYRVRQSDAELYRAAIELSADVPGASIVEAVKLVGEGHSASFATPGHDTAAMDDTYRRAKLIQLRNRTHPWMTAYRAALDEAEAVALAAAAPTDENLRLNRRARQLQSANLDLSYPAAMAEARRQFDADHSRGPRYL